MQPLHDFMPELLHTKRHSLRVLTAVGMAAALPRTGAQSPGKGSSKVVRIAAASDLKFALAPALAVFERDTGISVELNFGSSGNFARQILQGLPVDLFMSADEDWVFKVADAGLTQGGTSERGVVYAIGRLALIVHSALPMQIQMQTQADWPAVQSALRLALSDGAAQNARSPAGPLIQKFAIANPEHAPYGRAAQQALQAMGLWQSAQPRLVLGENVAQATQYVSVGAAQAGLTALPLAIAPEVAATTRYAAVPAALHAPLRQRMVLLKSAGPAAAQLYDYLQTEAVKKQLQNAGFAMK
jgi:molybdate transport system substrate-binding protein